MKIGLIGWYGHENWGDERMLYCLKKFFSDYEFFITNGWSDAKQKIDELNKCDYILIGGGGLALRNIGYRTNLIRDLKRPFGFIGISLEAKHRSVEEFYDIIKKDSDFIFVRDKQSKEYLDDHYKVVVGSDLTFLYPFDVVSEVKDDVCGFNLRYWYYWKSTLRNPYHNLMLTMDHKFPRIRKIYPFNKWDPNKAVNIVSGSFKTVVPMPFYFEKETMNDVVILSKYFENIPQTYEKGLYNKIRYLIGMRYHSIVFATQCGIPFISLSYQRKNSAFCFDMKFDTLSVDLDNINELENKIEYVKNHYHQIRERLILQREKANQEIKYLFQSISSLMKESIEDNRCTEMG